MSRIGWLFGLVLMVAAAPAAASTLDSVKARGSLRCGVSLGQPGFSEAVTEQVWRGMDVDFCRAVAAAVLGQGTKVTYVPLAAKQAEGALKAGEVDLVARASAWSLSRDIGADIAAVTYYDGQGFLAMRGQADLSGATICVEADTPALEVLKDDGRANTISYRPKPLAGARDIRRAYLARECSVVSGPISVLAGLRSTLPEPETHVILPKVISKEPLGPLVREGDDQWTDIVRWTHFAMVSGEELGVNSVNIFALRKSATRPDMRRLLGLEGDLGARLGLDRDWAARIIGQVGNYGEAFERNLGREGLIQLQRGLNALWTEGGLHYAPPMR